MATGYYITHPQVRVDPNVPVPDWGLSELGVRRATAMLAQPWAKTIHRVVSSAERKAIETAQILCEHIGVPVDIRERMHENDRSATGFLPPTEFETVADAFFADPGISVRGWERAIDAQTRIRGEVDAVLAMHRVVILHSLGTAPLERSYFCPCLAARSAAALISRREADISSPSISTHCACITNGGGLME